MDTVCRDIFRAVHENKWLSIEYKNKREEVTKYWIGIQDINPQFKTMQVEGLHLGQYLTTKLTIYIDSIQSSFLIEGSYYDVAKRLKEDIASNPYKYHSIFHNVANLQILNYFIDCNKLDTIPYKTEYALLNHFDGVCVRNGNYRLTAEQFQEIVANFQYGNAQNSTNCKIKQLALNILSVPTKQGLYVLAYKELKLDVKGDVFE